jgi:pimeloyl-ACP methyl ester carboxylesterase
MSRFVLVHGAWLGGWCWDEVAGNLKSVGHEVVVPDLPGHGEDKTPVSAISLGSYVDTVDKVTPDGSVLVGHSMAGIVISMLAERRPRAISALIYVAAYLLRSGESIAKASETATDSLVGPNMVPAADWSTISIKPKVVKDVFAADAPPEALKRLLAMTQAEPAAPFNTPVEVTAAKFGSVPRAYVRTARDQAVTSRLQDAMLAHSPCAQVMTMNTSHTPFFAAPAELAAALVELAAQGKGAGGSSRVYRNAARSR